MIEIFSKYNFDEIIEIITDINMRISETSERKYLILLDVISSKDLRKFR